MQSRTKIVTPLKAFLREEGRHQRWLAQRIGMHESEVSRIVNGLHPSDATQQAIAAALGRHPSDFWPTQPQQKEAA